MDFKYGKLTNRFLPKSPIPDNPFHDSDKNKKNNRVKRETKAEKLAAKSIRFGVYLRSRDLYTQKIADKTMLAQHTATALKERYEALEEMYPDFPKAYQDYKRDKS